MAFQGAPKATDGWAWIAEGPSWNLGPWRTWRQAKPGRKLSLQVAMMPSGMGVTLAQIAAGQHDTHYVKLANNLANYGMLDIELRIGHEMDGGWYAWNARAGSGKEASYAAAFRRIVTVMRNAQPTNKWRISWNPTADNWPLSTASAYFESIWPGDAYVDTVGVDLYDKSFGTGKVYYPSGSDRLQRQKEVWADLSKRANALRDFAVKHGKTMSFPEWGLVTYNPGTYVGWGGGDNPYFIQKMHEFFMDPANKVVMHAYFDVKNHEADVRVGPTNTIHPLASAKYKQLFRTGSHVQNGQTGSTGVVTVKNSTTSVSTTSAPPPGSTMSYDQLWATIKSANPLLDDNSLRTIVDSKWNDMRMPAAAPAPAPAPASSASPPPKPSRSTMSYDQLWNTIKSANPLLDDDSLRTIVDSRWNDMQ